MTTTGSGPVLHSPGAAGRRGSSVSMRRALRPRTVLSLARAEASMLARNWLVLSGLLAGAVVIWVFIRSAEPLWWHADWEIGGGQLVLAMTVLVAAQLAAGRPRRNAMADLYASFPATAGIRTLAQLIGLAGAVPASLLLLGAGAVVVQERGAIGAPSVMVLAGGVLLVIAAGAAGIAIGTRFAHPLAGVLGALALFMTAATTHLASGAGIWLLPSAILQNQLGALPGPLPGYPPAGAHALELAGIAALAGIVALVVTVSGARARGGLAAAAILALAVTCFAGSVQLRPLPTAELNHLVTEIADPASVQHCTTANQVGYCLYPGFGRDLSSLEAPVNEVLADLPAPPLTVPPLTVQQVVSLNITDPSLTHGHSARQISRWNAQVQNAPGAAPAASAIYLPVGSWPAAGGQLADAHFNVALATAEWAVRIPPTGGNQACVALDQAREPIAIWLAVLATHPPAGELQAGLGALETGRGFQAVEVRNTMVPIWNYPGAAVGPTPSGPQLTAVGYLLAQAMMSLPEQKVSHVLAEAWGSWLNWRTTDAQLAAALGIQMPSVSVPSGLQPPPGNQPGPQNPVCTT